MLAHEEILAMKCNVYVWGDVQTIDNGSSRLNVEKNWPSKNPVCITSNNCITNGLIKSIK